VAAGLDVLREGAGRPLLLIHGVGSTRRGWSPVLGSLSAEREVIAPDLPGHGASPRADRDLTFGGLSDALDAWLDQEGLVGVPAAGFSLGGRLVLELARRGRVGPVAALGPGGFWAGWERGYLSAKLNVLTWLARGMKGIVPSLASTRAGRVALMAQLSAKAGDLDPAYCVQEVTSLAETRTMDGLIGDLAWGPAQDGTAETPGPVAIGWGRHDRVCLPGQAQRAMQRFPQARLEWFEESGHLLHVDDPEKAARFVLEATG
jgi:pimeloyl-ACP methyl ester carboxylesterase